MLNWLFHFFIYLLKIFYLRNKIFRHVYQKIVSNSSVFESKKNDKMIQFFFFYYIRFVIPNSSNHCTRQHIFIMYSYVHIMFYFCMRDGGGDCGSSLAAARRQRQLGGGGCGCLVAAAWWRQLGGGSGSTVAVAAAAVAALQ